MATMKDVAREAGVSLGTVSNVLNNVSSVSEEYRDRVLSAIQKLNYRVNHAARTLKTNSSRTIGLIIPDISNPFYPELARGVEDTARKHDFSMLLCNNDRNPAKEREYIDILLEKNIDGIVLVKPYVGLDVLTEVQKYCPIVLVDLGYDISSRFDVINVDDDVGIRNALNLLYEYGHRRIGFISGLLESKSSILRRDTFIQFMKDHGAPDCEGLVRRGDYSWYSGYASTIDLLNETVAPTAVLAANDLMAIGAIKAAHERRLRIPFDISIMGYDDIDMASFYTPTLTTVRQPKYEIGISSVETLLNRIRERSEGTDASGSLQTLKTRVILRDSVGYAR